MRTYFCYVVLTISAGIGIPVMAALNASLGQQLNSSSAAAVVLFLVALVLSVVALYVVGLPVPSRIGSLSRHLFTGGAFVAFYVLSITWAAPQFGVANAIFFVLLGQVFSAAIIDHFGLLGALESPLSINRVLGLLLILVGVFLARRGI